MEDLAKDLWYWQDSETSKTPTDWKMMKSSIHCCVQLIMLIAVFFVVGAAQALEMTPFEESDGKKTPRYDETMAWCSNLAAASPILQMESFGVSPQRRSLPVIIADLQGEFVPGGSGPEQKKMVVLVQACIHAGESCGKDAGMMLLRDLVEDEQLAEDLLSKVTLLFIPIFNVDGHERFGPYNRVNQNGPQEMGWRVTARNLNLNRDFLKADTIEMRNWLALYQKWSPDFLVDIHSTDGADYQYAITYGLETGGNMDKALTTWTENYCTAMNEAMEQVGYPMAPYVSFVQWHDPRSGLVSWVAGPRYSQGYAAIQNRPGLLIETHMLKDYHIRVDAARELVVKTLRWINNSGSNLGELNLAADHFAASEEFRSQPFPLTFKRTENSRPFNFLGVDYETLESEVTGGTWNKFSSVSDTFVVEYFDESLPSETAELPEAYIIPPQWTEVVERLDWHGVKYRRLAEAVEIPIRTYRFHDAQWRERPYEGRHTLTFEQESIQELRLFPSGSVVVDMNQRTARVIAHLLEPKGPDSLVGWGFFDAVFERVEYIESYVIEAMIIQMMSDDPSLAEKLADRKANDPEFANSPSAIRNWFYERTPYYDQRVGVYPVGMVDERGLLENVVYLKH